MQNNAEQAEGFGAIELVAHGVHGLLAKRPGGGREIDEITRVRDDRAESRAADAATKLANLTGKQRAAAPLARVLREDLERLAAVHDRALHRARQTAGHRHVRTQASHLDRSCN